MTSDLAERTLVEAADLVHRGDASPRDLVGACLARVDATNDLLNAWIELHRDEAFVVADALEAMLGAGHVLGALHGVPVAIKDDMAQVGRHARAGTQVLGDEPAAADATVVGRLRGSGGILLGRTNMDEGALGMNSANPHHGPVLSPWGRDRRVGGSSGGAAAALASGMVFGALGTDTGGSVRIPAALNGLVGLRPTFGRASRAGIAPAGWTLDTVGPLGRSVRDCALLFDLIAGFDPADERTELAPAGGGLAATHRPPVAPRIGVISGYTLDRLEPVVRVAMDAAIATLEQLGATVVEVDVDGVHDQLVPQIVLMTIEPAALHHHRMVDQPEAYGDEVRTLLAAGHLWSGVDYVQAQRSRTLLRRAALAALGDVDALLVPSFPIAGPRVAQETVDLGDGEDPLLEHMVRFVGFSPLTGLPSLALPCGVDDEGGPIGMELIGAPFGEAGLLRLGAAFEDATGLRSRVPRPVEAILAAHTTS